MSAGRESRIRTLVLYAEYAAPLGYFDDWREAFLAAPGFDVTAMNVCRPATRRGLKRTIGDFDLIVLLHSTNGDTLAYIEPYRDLLQHRRGLLLSFVGNELNLPGSPVADKIRFFTAVEPDFIATQMLLEAGEYLFADCVRRHVVAMPHALNPDAYRPEAPLDGRPIDIGVRSARYVAHLGDNDRNRLLDLFAGHAFEPPLRIDIDTQARLDRAGWARFLNQCKGTVATEAGGWYLQRDDRTVSAIRDWTRSRAGGIVIANDSPLRTLGHKLPWSLRAALRRLLSRGPLRHEIKVNESVAFEEVYERFFRDLPRAPVYAKCVSSRHFDAAGTKTCQIMLRGRYNDILVADRHYLALEPDFSNLDGVMARFRDPSLRQRMVDETFEYVMAEHTYRHRMRDIHALVTA